MVSREGGALGFCLSVLLSDLSLLLTDEEVHAREDTRCYLSKISFLVGFWKSAASISCSVFQQLEQVIVLDDTCFLSLSVCLLLRFTAPILDQVLPVDCLCEPLVQGHIVIGDPSSRVQ